MLNEFFTDEFLERARNILRMVSPVIGILLFGLAIYYGIMRPMQRNFELLEQISDDNPGISISGAYAAATRLAIGATAAAEAYATEGAQLAEAEATKAALRATEESIALTTKDDASAGDNNESAFDKDALVAAFSKGGCLGCHIIPDIPGAVGAVGPDLTGLGRIAATRLDGYTAEEYIRESIMDPDAYIAPECPTGACIAGLMQPSFGASLSNTELALVVDYLAQLD